MDRRSAAAGGTRGPPASRRRRTARAVPVRRSPARRASASGTPRACGVDRISARTRFTRAPRRGRGAASSKRQAALARRAQRRGVMLLDRTRLGRLPAERLDAAHGREDAGQRRDAGHARPPRRAVRMKEPSVRGARPNGVLITRSTRPAADQLDDVVRSPSETLATGSTGIPRAPEHARRAARRQQAEPEVGQTLRGEHDRPLVAVGDADEHRAARSGSACPAATIALASAMPGVARRSPSPRPSTSSRARAPCRRPGTVRTAGPRPSRSCTADAGSGAGRRAASPSARERPRASRPVQHQRRHPRERDADHLRDERHRARGARVRLEHPDPLVLDRELEVQQPDARRAAARAGRVMSSIASSSSSESVGRRDLRTTSRPSGRPPPRCAPSPRRRTRRRAVARRRRRRPRSRPRGTGRSGPGARARPRPPSRTNALELVVVVDDLHRAAAEHVGRAHDHRDTRSARRPRAPPRACAPRRGAAPGSRARAGSRANLPAILGEVDRVGRGARGSGTPRSLQRPRELAAASGRRTARSRPTGRSRSADGQHVLGRQRLEVQPARRVVVGRDGLGIRVDHHRLEPRLLEREGRMHAGVVELDPLADPVRARRRGSPPAVGRAARTSVSSS